MNVAHLAGRFITSLDPRRPGRQKEHFVRRISTGERALWDRMSAPDQRHAVGVAAKVVAKLGRERVDEQPWLVPAALLHDVGKIESGLGTWERVGATLVGPRLARGDWAAYFAHPEIGGRLLREAGSHELTALWAEDHHQPHDAWRVPWSLGMALKAGDDD